MKLFTDAKAVETMRLDLERWASSPGEARLAFEQHLGGVSANEVAFSCTYGRGASYVMGNGDILTKTEYESKMKETALAPVRLELEEAYKAAAHGGYIHKHLRRVSPGAAPLNKVIKMSGGEVRIPCGVCVILGASNTGKTPLAHMLASADVESYSVVRAGEPFAGYQSSQFDISKSLAEAMVESSDIVLDSIKDLLSGDGAAMKGGLSRGVLLDLSIWSSLAASIGCTIYIPMNPSSPDEVIMAMLREAALGNATMIVSYKERDTWEFVARRGEGLRRDSGTMTVAKNFLGSSQTAEASAARVNAKVVVGRDEFAESVLSRVLRDSHK